MKSLFLIKLGGSVITDKKREFSARGKNILRLAREIKKAKGKLGKNAFFIIGHGGGSFAHTPAARYKTKEGIVNRESIMGAAFTEDAARRLNMIVVNNFLKEKLPVFSFSPASFLFNDPKVSKKSYFDPIIKALEIGLMPITYGDVIMDSKFGFTIFSTEKILFLVAARLKKDYEISQFYVTGTSGVYDENGNTISVISDKNFNRLKTSITGAKTVDVTGGMIHKVESAVYMSKKHKIKTVILNGLKEGQLYKALTGKKTISTRVIY